MHIKFGQCQNLVSRTFQSGFTLFIRASLGKCHVLSSAANGITRVLIVDSIFIKSR